MDGGYWFIWLRMAASGRCCGYNSVLLAGKCVDPSNESQFLKRVCYFGGHWCVCYTEPLNAFCGILV